MRHLALLLLTLSAMPSHATPRRTWVAVGDSITNGHSFDASTYPARLETLLGAPVENMGIGGETAAQARTRWQNYAENYPYKGVIIEIGTNDLAASTAGATVWATVDAWIEEAQAAGQRVVLCTVFPRNGSAGWTGAMETQRQAFNTSARAKAAGDPTIILIDGDTVLSDDGVTLRAAFDYGDAVHLDGDGFQALAEAIADEL
jgi:lysophospholipase L1-like esterase